MKLLKKFFSDEGGVTLIEYALIAALLAMAVVVALGIAGDAVTEFFEYLGSELEDAYSRSQ